MSSPIEKIAFEALNLLLIRLHAEICPECREKLQSIIKHAYEEATKDAKKMSI